jgi:pimeloyl-ACP methyl ester carboxylesterase
LAAIHPLDPQRVVVVGHSSGGYFGAWLAGRHHLPSGSPLVGALPLKLSGAVLLDAFLDPRVIDSRGVDGRLFCDEPVLARLIGGLPDSVPHQLRQASPLALLPFGIPQEYVVSSLRYPVTPARPLAAGRTTLAVQDYPRLAKEAGDSVGVQIVSDADHFDFLKPSTKAWLAVESALARILKTDSSGGQR